MFYECKKTTYCTTGSRQVDKVLFHISNYIKYSMKHYNIHNNCNIKSWMRIECLRAAPTDCIFTRLAIWQWKSFTEAYKNRTIVKSLLVYWFCCHCVILSSMIALHPSLLVVGWYANLCPSILYCPHKLSLDSILNTERNADLYWELTLLGLLMMKSYCVIHNDSLNQSIFQFWWNACIELNKCKVCKVE